MARKLWFYDFDRTLCAHDYPKVGVKWTDMSLLLCQYRDSDILTNGDRPIRAMQWHVSMRSPEDKLFCLTHQLSNLREAYIKDFLNKHYNGSLEYIEVATPELKIVAIEAIAEALSVSLGNCYLIEDRMDTVHMACDAGINGIHISNIYVEYENYLEHK